MPGYYRLSGSQDGLPVYVNLLIFGLLPISALSTLIGIELVGSREVISEELGALHSTPY